ncbi:hypothetical protein [Paenibacillus lemnae]|uniref:Permuted papain-like amidase enzyme, YaeF/YiiX, C92 family n=1 Tax=Paenibacillus lemnae TaxID=1330551 RepID=A0A848MAI4_PAELE|nr:hypothetical protein [Paenibacillus lemnae]NMO97211.1 hypothetical protein [Paenibacillus lemnae]
MSTEQDIWIVLTGTGTWFSRMIQCFTNAPLNHASIAFDSELREVYSFGRKQANNPFSGGMVCENLRSPFFYSSQCAVYRCAVSKRDYDRMYHLVQQMMDHQDMYKYNLLGLLGILFRLHIDRDNAYFCSHFVATVFEQAGIRPVDKPPHLVTPGDFSNSPQLQELYHGPLHGYLKNMPLSISSHTASSFSSPAEHSDRGKLIRIGT